MRLGTVPRYKQLANKYHYGDPTVVAKAGSQSNGYENDWALYGLNIGVMGLSDPTTIIVYNIHHFFYTSHYQ